MTHGAKAQGVGYLQTCKGRKRHGCGETSQAWHRKTTGVLRTLTWTAEGHMDSRGTHGPGDEHQGTAAQMAGWAE